MPFLGDESDDFNFVQSDLLDGNCVGYPAHDNHDEEFQAAAAASVPEADEEDETEDEEEEDDILPPPVADMGEDMDASPASARKAKTLRLAKKTATPATSGRKRKSAAVDLTENSTPAKKRGRPARAAAAPSARASVREANKPKRGRPAGASTTAAKATKTTKGKGGRPKKGGADGPVPENEFEVEEIVEARIDADTMQHMYNVKWKGYPSSENTWEPKSNLAHAMDLVRNFDASKKGKASKAQAAPADKERKKPGRPKAKAQPPAP